MDWAFTKWSNELCFLVHVISYNVVVLDTQYMESSVVELTKNTGDLGLIPSPVTYYSSPSSITTYMYFIYSADRHPVFINDQLLWLEQRPTAVSECDQWLHHSPLWGHRPAPLLSGITDQHLQALQTHLLHEWVSLHHIFYQRPLSLFYW